MSTTRTDIDIVDRLRIAWTSCHDRINEERAQAAEEIERLCKDRDEARRLYCDYAIRNGRVYRRVGNDTVRCQTPQEVADDLGWDCFKEAP